MTDIHTFKVDAMLADSAVVSEGKLYVQGGAWNQIVSAQFPFAQPRLSLAISVSVPYGQTNMNHRLEVQLRDQDERQLPLGRAPGPNGEIKEVLAVGAQFNIGRPATIEAGDRQVVAFALNLDRMEFTSPGAHHICIFIDTVEHNRLDFRVASPAGVTLSP